ncbi:hypothetical protein BCR37DRAFT_378331 [Protomyces lactucae-debilis]|uniref:JmjC domain-containing histone demethylation protein 1 n=1 Tax=Protomyces lactucae-debilis TaxID=2754530 RepID=A0A1Y2FK46_PROLT|nr:uncharacterized protein BCR37DRAFT_378331 [Protomyces lactucae-debilis]ORY84320.1 hypothetical protein BCR37DRAFT_378331 [Protomyces lactucae-debilis]
MKKRKQEEESDERCPACTASGPPPAQQIAVDWIACEHCETWYHCACLQLILATVDTHYCSMCTDAGYGQTVLRDGRPRRARAGVDYNALDAGEHVNALRHKYTTLCQERSFAPAAVREVADGATLRKRLLDVEGFDEPIVVRNQQGLDMTIQQDLTVDEVARRVGRDKPLEVMDVPTQGEDTGWTLGRWADYYKEAQPTRVRNVISLELSDSTLGQEMQRPKVVRELDLIDQFWDPEEFDKGAYPKVRLYCLMSLTNSYTDFHVDFAGTSVFYHILAGQKTFLFIRPTAANLKKYSDWCLSSNQASTFLADACKDTFKVDLMQGDTMFIPSGWIHAVHTPAKSLVIGGNFLSLLGLQRHLDIVAIEQRTKVPGKFRFPQLARTLWYTLLGCLASPERIATQVEWAGLSRLASYLVPQARVITGDHIDGVVASTAKKEYPSAAIRGDALYLIAVFSNMLARLAKERGYNSDAELVDYRGAEQGLSIRVTRRIKGDTGYKRSWVPLSPDGRILGSGRKPSDAVKVEEESAAPSPVVVLACPEESSDPIVQNNTYLPPPMLGSDPPKPSLIPGKLPPLPIGLPTVPAKIVQPVIPPPIPAIVAPAAIVTTAATAIAQPGTAETDGMACFRCKARKRRCDRERPCAACCLIGADASCGTARTANYDAFQGAPKGGRKKARLEEEVGIPIATRGDSVASSSHSVMTL